MKNSEIREMSLGDLHDKIDTESALLFKLKMSHAISPIENPMKIRITRRNIARLKTELRKRELQKKESAVSSKQSSSAKDSEDK